nr:hypothetical protein [uncultured Desulfobulbus sp.]
MRLWCCPYFKKEVEAVVSGSQKLAKLHIQTYSYSCQQSFQKGSAHWPNFFEDQASELNTIIGGGCLAGSPFVVENFESGNVLAPQFCFELDSPSDAG